MNNVSYGKKFCLGCCGFFHGTTGPVQRFELHEMFPPQQLEKIPASWQGYLNPLFGQPALVKTFADHALMWHCFAIVMTIFANL
jgi:hypothetical protein